MADDSMKLAALKEKHEQVVAALKEKHAKQLEKVAAKAEAQAVKAAAKATKEKAKLLETITLLDLLLTDISNLATKDSPLTSVLQEILKRTAKAAKVYEKHLTGK